MKKNLSNLNGSVATIRRRFVKIKLKYQGNVKKSLLSEKHIEQGHEKTKTSSTTYFEPFKIGVPCFIVSEKNSFQ